MQDPLDEPFIPTDKQILEYLWNIVNLKYFTKNDCDQMRAISSVIENENDRKILQHVINIYIHAKCPKKSLPYLCKFILIKHISDIESRLNKSC